MKNIFFIFIFISLFSQIANSEILTSEPSLNEPLEILIEGAGNDSIILIKPNSDGKEIFLTDGYAQVKLDLDGKWAIEHSRERKEIEVLNLENYSADEEDKKAGEDYFWIRIVFAGFIAFVILAAAAGIWFAYFGPSQKKEPKLNGRAENGKLRAVFESGSRPLDRVEVYFGSRKIMSSKKMAAFEKIEIVRASLGADGKEKLHATFFENWKKMKILQAGQAEEIASISHISKRRLEKI